MTQPTPDDLRPAAARLCYAEVLIEIGDLTLAEMEVAEVLDESPEHHDALSLQPGAAPYHRHQR